MKHRLVIVIVITITSLLDLVVPVRLHLLYSHRSFLSRLLCILADASCDSKEKKRSLMTHCPKDNFSETSSRNDYVTHEDFSKILTNGDIHLRLLLSLSIICYRTADWLELTALACDSAYLSDAFPKNY